jgi:two-component system response regulator AlgR
MTLASRRFRGLTLDAELINCWPKALLKKELVKHAAIGFEDDFAKYFLQIQERGKTLSVALSEVLYLKAEMKYITVHTAARRYIFVGSLAALEARHPWHFIRIHRHTLVARHAVTALGSVVEAQTPGSWAVRLEGVDEPLAVSRRQLSALRTSLSPCCAAPPQCR